METLDPVLDQPRITSQRNRILALLLKGDRFTLRQLSDLSGASESGASARLRGLRADGYKIEKQRLGVSGLWVYWMVKA